VTREGMRRITQPGQWGKNVRTHWRYFVVSVCGALLFLFSHVACAQEAEPRAVYLVGSGNPALDLYMTQLLENSLGDDVSLRQLTNGQTATLDGAPIVTIGPSAFSKVRQSNRDTPILALLVERSFIQDYAEDNRGQISAVFYDVPLELQAVIGKAILPQATKVAIIATSETVGLYEQVLDQLPSIGLQPRVFIVDSQKELIPTLARALSFGDFLLAGPDDVLYNPRTIKHILLTAYRRNRIVIGPSQAYVKAGALASGYAPFPVMAEAAAAQLRQFVESGEFPAPEYPGRYSVEINDQVARSLNIPLPDEEALDQDLARARAQYGGIGE